MAKALEGIRVLDFSRMYAGPFCTMFLAELGADVIKLEIPGSGDGVRDLPPMTEGMESYIFVILNRGKRAITLNLNSDKGRDICHKLVKKADVLVENFTPGIMDRFGLDYNSLKTENPGLVYVSISGFGHEGPNRCLPAFDTVIQAMGGIISVNGHPDTPPTKVGPAIGDLSGGLYGAVSVLAALQHRNRTGQGQCVDLSLQDCVWLLSAVQNLPGLMLTGQEPRKLGNRMVEVTPFNLYPAKDGWVVIAVVTVGQWRKFVDLIGRGDLKNVPEYAVQNDRIKHMDVIDGIVTGWTKDKTVSEILALLGAADLPCASVPTFRQVASDPHLLSRNMVMDVEQVVSGTLKVPGSVFKMSETPGDASKSAPFLGQHNNEVYAELLGYGPEAVARFQDEGII